jgi:acetyl esterase/lipase
MMRVRNTLGVSLAVGTLLAGCGGTAGAPTSAAPVPLVRLVASGAGHRFYEIYDAIGPTRGTMIVIHGGAWQDQRGNARRMMATTALAFRALGWRVVNIGYSPLQPRGVKPDPRPMLRDVVAFYDQIRRAFGGPICADGDSAGGYLAAELAIQRPSLSCAIPNAAPLDLPTAVQQTVPEIRPFIPQTFGSSQSDLIKYSPARQWHSNVDHTPIFATAASNDTVVPPAQLRAFAAADPSADVAVVPGASTDSADAVQWEHSVVNRDALGARFAALERWLNRIAPAPASAPPANNIGANCDRPVSNGDRYKLLLEGDAWQQVSTPKQPIAATRGCSGSASWQDDGLSLWVLPSSSDTLPEGAQASLVLSTGGALHHVSAAFRGFLARPADWALGLYASTSSEGPLQTRVATCVSGQCSGLRFVSRDGGALIAASGSRGDPDMQTPPDASFALPSGTRRVAWELQCVSSDGCSQAGIADQPGNSLRWRDPLGHPAIFSIYSVNVN